MHLLPLLISLISVTSIQATICPTPYDYRGNELYSADKLYIKTLPRSQIPQNDLAILDRTYGRVSQVSKFCNCNLNRGKWEVHKITVDIQGGQTRTDIGAFSWIGKRSAEFLGLIKRGLTSVLSSDRQGICNFVKDNYSKFPDGMNIAKAFLRSIQINIDFCV